MKPSERGRLQKMRDVYEADTSSDFEVRAALSRYRARTRDAKRRGGLWLNFGLGFAGMGVLLVVVHVTVIAPSESPSTLASNDVSASPAPEGNQHAELEARETDSEIPSAAATHHELAFVATILRGDEETPVQPGIPYLVERGESVEVHTGGEVQTVQGPATLEFQLDPDRASGWRMVITPGDVQASEQGAKKPRTETPARDAVQDTLSERIQAGREKHGLDNASPKTAAEQRTTWTEAAEALRAGDNARARDALSRLGQSESAQTRDSAQLTLAQLRLAEGRGDEARTILRRLAREGATPFIRRRASELMSQ